MPIVLFYAWNGNHLIKQSNDKRPSTVELLEERAEMWDDGIAEWEPESRWDEANQRSLRWLHERRAKTEKAIERLINKEKELAIKQRKRADEQSKDNRKLDI